MGQGVDEVEIENLVESSRVLEHQGFLIEIIEDREEFIIFRHKDTFAQEW
jgi:hypothetical protein